MTRNKKYIFCYDEERSTLEIWGDMYINNKEDRSEKDRDAKILQIEVGSFTGNNVYIVEVIRP